MLKTREQALAIALNFGITDPVILFGFRSPTSKYGQYDDILALLTPDDYKEYKGNTLPSVDRQGVAVLQPGAYQYAQGLHGVNHLPMDEHGHCITAQDQQIYDWLIAHKGQDYPHVVKDGKGNARLLPYWAYRQAGPVRIQRIGATGFEIETDKWKYPFIDIHEGGRNLTSSLGCQTFHPDGWEDVRSRGYAAMDAAGMRQVTYLLTHQ